MSASVMNGFCANLALISVIFNCNFLGLSVRQCWHLVFAAASKVATIHQRKSITETFFNVHRSEHMIFCLLITGCHYEVDVLRVRF